MKNSRTKKIMNQMEKNTVTPNETLDFTSKFILWFSASIVLLTFIYIFCITFLDIPKDNQKFADIILGFLAGTMASSVINYYFGSSHGSKKKDETLELLSALQNDVMYNVQKRFDDVRAGLEEGIEDDNEKEEKNIYSEGFETSEENGLDVSDDDLDRVNK